MKAQISLISSVVTLLSLSIAANVSAGVILGPAAVSTTIANEPGRTPDLVINQSGLSAGYTSLSTDFDAYIASNPEHNANGTDKAWLSTDSFTSGYLDFDLGGTYVVESMALWNIGGGVKPNLKTFELYASDDASFGTSTLLGSYSAQTGLGQTTANPAEIFAFGPTSASFIRMVILTGNGGVNVGFGEVAFEVSSPPAVPEPASLVLLASGLAGTLAARRKRRGSC